MPENIYRVAFEAACTDIIQRATSIVNYDLRDQPQSPDSSAQMPRVCPVLWDLYAANDKKSDTKIQHNQCTVFPK